MGAGPTGPTGAGPTGPTGNGPTGPTGAGMAGPTGPTGPNGGGGGITQIVLTPSGDTSGATDLANWQAAFVTLAASTRLPPLASAYYTTTRIYLNPGTFYFTASVGNILAATSLKTVGIWIQGSGQGTSSIDYNPSSSAPLFTNNHGLDVKMTDMTCIGHDANSDFLWSQEQAGLTNIQDYTFQDIAWGGVWNNIFRLTGGNNNSEWKFDRATIAGTLNGSWIYVPPSVATTITNGSSTIATTNNAWQVEVGDTGQFSAAVAPLGANTQYYVVSASATTFQVSTSFGGSPVTFTANGTPNFQTGSDQFLNFWFDKCKLDTSTSAGQWLTMNYGGSIKIRDSDISGHAPAAVSYVFNLLGTVPHNSGVMNFEVDGLRVEHASTNSRLIHSQWTGGSISFNNLDEDSQVNRWPITNAYAFYEIINNTGPQIQ